MVETLSRSRVVLAPKTQTNKEFEEILKPIAIDGDKSQLTIEEYVKLKYIVTGDDEEEEMNERYHNEAPSQEKKQKGKQKDDHAHESNETKRNEKKNEAPTEVFGLTRSLTI